MLDDPETVKRCEGVTAIEKISVGCASGMSRRGQIPFASASIDAAPYDIRLLEHYLGDQDGNYFTN
ncbi:hypothetical protein AC579_4323 [Pseudocercospora musae]|uniref:Uncharacterized protein n=1 Tax=Pseudocercospora musae TaxID=113226 RepID=A0A139IR26_9PEZI|nr:hypothetical protein AC579_4323 [Pseudocercospora musae]